MNYFNESKAYESEVKKTYDKTSVGDTKDYNKGMMDSQMCCDASPCGMPIYECPRERVCHRYICYEVPQE